MTQRSPSHRRAWNDVWQVALALAIFVAVGLWWLHLSANARQERAKVLAEVPVFPREHPRPRPVSDLPPLATPPRTPEPVPRTHLDPVRRFLQNASSKGGSVVAVHMNAILNSPFFQRMPACLDAQRIRAMETDAGSGLDVTRDIDQFAVGDHGTVFTGSFDGKPDPLITCRSPESGGDYRGFALYRCPGATYALQGSTLVQADEGDGNLQTLVDDVLDPPPGDSPAPDLSGDFYGHWSLADGTPPAGGSTVNQALGNVLTHLSSITVRANVWNDAAISIDGEPAVGESEQDLTTAAQGLLGVVKGQIDDNDIRSSALASLANVRQEGGMMKADLALASDQFGEQMNAMCERERKSEEEIRARRGQAEEESGGSGTEGKR